MNLVQNIDKGGNNIWKKSSKITLTLVRYKHFGTFQNEKHSTFNGIDGVFVTTVAAGCNIFF